jgi:thiol-disulfide isomerase/thioredoxin
MLSKELNHFPAAKAIQEYLDLEKKQLLISKLTYTSGKDSLIGFNYYVVDFWGSWCGPCIASIPAVKELYQVYRPKNVQFISLAYEKKDLVHYYKAQAEHRMPWPQAYVLTQDDEKTLIDEYYITAFPTYLILDSNFQIRHRIIANHEELAVTLKKL